MRISDWSSDVCSSDLPIIGGVGIGVLGVVGIAILWFTVELPEDPPALRSAVVVGVDGRELAVLSQDGQRFEVPLGDVAPVVVDALIAAEDRRFYDHSGIDPIGISRALWSNVTSSGTPGGSTPTQRSEEHTSELQSLMSLSYAVHC